MKNYYVNDKEQSKTFITNYEIKDNQIIVYLASGKNYSVPYTQDNEEKILVKMEKQTFVSNSFTTDLKLNITFSRVLKIVFLCISALLFLITTCVPSFIPSAIGLSIGLLLPTSLNIKRKKDLLKDYEKQIFLLDNEKKLNDANEKDPNVLANVSKKTKEIISSVPSEKPKFTLNTIHKMKYQDLKEIIENIQIIEALGYDYQNIEEETTTEDQKRYSK